MLGMKNHFDISIEIREVDIAGVACSKKTCEHYLLHQTGMKFQGGHWSGRSQGNLIFLQGQGKVREFCKLVREILNTKKVRERSGNFIILAQNMCCSRYFD